MIKIIENCYLFFERCRLGLRAFITKKIYLVAGLPRSCSTLLMNILGQNKEFYVTPTSGILDMISQVRNSWELNDVTVHANTKERFSVLKST
jgi:hypothetical protein